MRKKKYLIIIPLLILMVVGLYLIVPKSKAYGSSINGIFTSNNAYYYYSFKPDGSTTEDNSKFNYLEGYICVKNATVDSATKENDFILQKWEESSEGKSYCNNNNSISYDKAYYFKVISKTIYTKDNVTGKSSDYNGSTSRLDEKTISFIKLDINIDYNSNYRLDIAPLNQSRYKELNNVQIKTEAYDLNGNKITKVKENEEYKYKITINGIDNPIETDALQLRVTLPSGVEVLNGLSTTQNLGKFPTGDYEKIINLNVKSTATTGNITTTSKIYINNVEKVSSSNTLTVANANLTINNTLNKSSVSAGDTIQYTIAVKNSGDIKADSVSIFDELNSNLEFVSSNPNYTSLTSNTYRYDYNSIAVNETKTIKINAKVKENTTINKITNCASWQYDSKDGEKCIDITILQPSLTITQDVNKTEVKKREQFTYTIKVKNNGSGTANNVKISDTIDSNIEIISVNGTNTSNNKVELTYDKILTNEEKTITIIARAKNTASLGNITNTAYLTSDNNSNINAAKTIKIVDSNLTVETILKDVTNNTVKPNDTFKYTIKVSNTGDASSNATVLTDTINSNLTIKSSDGATVNGNKLTWNLASIPKGSSVEKTVTVTVKATVPLGNISNYATLTDGDSSIISNVVNVTVEKANVELKTEAYNAKGYKTIKPGETFNYKITVTNNSNVKSDKIDIIDNIPSDFEITDKAGATQNGNKLSWTITSLNAKETKTYIISVKLKENVENSKSIINEVSLSHNSETKKASDTITVINSDIYLDISSSKEKVKPNETFDYIIRLSNLGTTSQDSLELNLTIPNELIINGINKVSNKSNNSSTYNNKQDIKVTINSLAVDEEITVTISVQAKDNLTDNTKVANKAILTYNNKTLESISNILIIDSDVNVSVTPSSKNIPLNQEFYYTITITNNGGADAQNINVVDTIDSNLQIIDSNNAKENNHKLSWNIENLEAKNSVTYTIKVKLIDGNIGDSISNSVSVSSTNKELKNTSANITIIDTLKNDDITIKILANESVITKNKEFTYSIIVRNNSDYAIDNVEIIDELDSNLAFVLSSNSTVEENTIKWNISLNAGEEKVIELKVKVNDVNPKTKITNSVRYSYYNIEKQSNEVSFEVSEIDNPQTGVGYTAVLTLLISSFIVIYIIFKKKKKLYHI